MVKSHGKSTNTRAKAAFGKMKFVLNNLDDGQLEQLASWEKGEIDLWSFIDTAIANGLSVKFDHDNFSGGIQCIVTGAWKGFASENFGVSGYSRHGADDAALVACFKVAVVCEFDLSSMSDRETRSKDRG